MSFVTGIPLELSCIAVAHEKYEPYIFEGFGASPQARHRNPWQPLTGSPKAQILFVIFDYSSVTQYLGLRSSMYDLRGWLLRSL